MFELPRFFSNAGRGDTTLNFFTHLAPAAKIAALACPFFSDYRAVECLSSAGCSTSLLIRLSSATHPNALRQAVSDPRVKTRYFTKASFHAKFYLMDDHALVGSANLTGSGLLTNRELSIVLNRADEDSFDFLVSLFEELWEQADVLTPEILEDYDRFWRRSVFGFRCDCVTGCFDVAAVAERVTDVYSLRTSSAP